MMTSFYLILAGVAIAIAGAYHSSRCQHRRRAGKLPEDIQ